MPNQTDTTNTTVETWLTCSRCAQQWPYWAQIPICLDPANDNTVRCIPTAPAARADDGEACGECGDTLDDRVDDMEHLRCKGCPDHQCQPGGCPDCSIADRDAAQSAANTARNWAECLRDEFTSDISLPNEFHAVQLSRQDADTIAALLECGFCAENARLRQATEAALHWLMEESDKPGEAKPCAILRVLLNALGVDGAPRATAVSEVARLADIAEESRRDLAEQNERLRSRYADVGGMLTGVIDVLETICDGQPDDRPRDPETLRLARSVLEAAKAVSSTNTAAAPTPQQALMAALQHHLSVKTINNRLVKSIKCADGMTVSVQASEYNYCSPRHNEGPWSTVELGFPSVEPNATIMQRCESPSQPTETVYGYVPIEHVVEWLLEHGGCPEIEAALAKVQP